MRHHATAWVVLDTPRDWLPRCFLGHTDRSRVCGCPHGLLGTCGQREREERDSRLRALRAREREGVLLGAVILSFALLTLGPDC